MSKVEGNKRNTVEDENIAGASGGSPCPSPTVSAATAEEATEMTNDISSVGLDKGTDAPDTIDIASSRLAADETEAVTSEQPTGDIPSAEEMDDRKDVQSSADNLLPTDKLENGLKHARMLFATGWAGFTASVRDLERTETVGKMKENTVTMIDKSMDGLSKVGSKVVEVTDRGVQAVGAKMDEAAPAVGRWRDEVVVASERGFAAAKEMTDKAIAEIRKPGGTEGRGQTSWGSGTVGNGRDDGDHDDDARPSGVDEGPHTV